MEPEAAQMEVERRLRDVGARFGSLPDADDELLRLIEEADTWLSRVDQSPPEHMYSALRPTMSALIKKELLNHADPDINVAVASCLTEVTRITAPDAPYDDDVMRDVFTIVVEAFGKLDGMDSPSFARRVAMLETVAKVRSCVLMLDLECDDLIQDTFHHFFRTVSLTHEENVISSMETIMMFVIKESEPVHPDLASCLLRNVKKEKKESLPAAFALAERVIGLCSEKLKPAFIQLLQGTPLNEYSKVVTLLVQGSSDTGGDDKLDASVKDMVADKKISQMAVSDESPQESSKLEKDVNCPVQDGTPPSSVPTTSLSNGGASVDNVKSPNGPASSKQKPELPTDDKQTKISDESLSGDKEAAEPVITEAEKLSEINSKKTHKLDTSTESEVTEHPKVVSNNQGLVTSGELSLGTNDGNNKLILETCNGAADDTSKPVDGTPAVDKSKRGWPQAAKSHEKKPVGKRQGSGLESKEVGPGSTSRGRAARRLGKDDIKSSSRKTGEKESSKKQPKASLNMPKEDTLSNEDTDEDLSLKEMLPPKSLTKMGKTKGQPGDSVGLKRKNVHEAEEDTQSKKNRVLDGSLVGSRIKVWWPDDKKFYDGVVKSFDGSSKKHKIVYDDGDVEQLLLKNEKWEFTAEVCSLKNEKWEFTAEVCSLKNEKWEFTAEEQDSNPDAASDMPCVRRGQGILSQQTKEGKTETPNSSKQNSIDDSNLPKKRGRPKAVRLSNSMTNDDSPVTSPRLKVKSAEKDAEEAPKTGSNLKNEGGRRSRFTSKLTNEDEAGSTKSANRSKDEAGSKCKDSKDKTKSSESNPKGASTPKASDGSKTNGLSTKRKPNEIEGESSEEEEQGSAKISTGKKRRRKSRS